MQHKTNPNAKSTIRLAQTDESPSAKPSVNDLRQLSFFRDQASSSLGLTPTDSRYEYRELDAIPVREVNELEQLRTQVAALRDANDRLKFLMGEVQYLLKV